MVKNNIKITTMGGGTGNSTLLKGLKKYFNNITAIVTVADDGGSSGMIRDDFGVLPPGDIRACLISLANTEKSMEKLMNYRFKDGNLKGQNFGNLLLVAMADIYKDFVFGIRETSNILAITGKVLPVSLDDITLFAELEDGSIIKGESNIPFLNKIRKSRIKKVSISPEFAKPLNEVVEEIYNSDIIVIGPGSLYTSIIPNLLIADIRKALLNTNAKIYYVLNVMSQSGETYNYSVSDHINAIFDHFNDICIDTVVVNNKKITDDLKLKYKNKGSEQILLQDNDRKYINSLGIDLIEGNLIKTDEYFLRHDGNKLAKIILDDYVEKSNSI